MLRVSSTAAVLIGFAAVLAAPPPARAQVKAGDEQFPLAKGSYWIYEGTEKSQKSGPTVYTKKIKWRMEVVERIERARIVATVVRGYPGEVGSYEHPDLSLLIAVDGTDFYRLPAKKSLLKRLKDPNDALVDLVREDDIALSLPLVPGKRFCEASQIARPDGYYCWVVEQQKKEKLTNLHGVAGDVERNVYQIAFRTLPDHAIVNFAPGIGITSYHYADNGPITYTVDVDLIEFHSGTVPAH